MIAAAAIFLTPSSGAADASLDADEQEFFRLLNDYRVDNGRVALVLQDDLNEASDWFVNDMTSKNYYGGDQYCAQNFSLPAHCDSLGRMPPGRAMAWGYPQGVGENLAAGFPTAQSVFDAWKASSGHNSNMLGSSYRAIGIGKSCSSSAYYHCYWVTDFGFYTGPGSPPGPGGTTFSPPPTSPVSATSTKSPTLTPTPLPTGAPTPTPTLSPPPAPTNTPTPTLATNVWDDFNCDGHVAPDDAVGLLRGDLGIDSIGAGCPAVSDLIMVNGVLRTWGDTDCLGGVQVIDSIRLLAFLAGVFFDGVSSNCPNPGTLF